MLEWISYHRADFAAGIILILLVALCWSVWVGVRWSRAHDSEQVFGDPERTKGGWFWVVSGVSVLLLLWFYMSWGVARAYFPLAVNELCQVGKVEESVSIIKARLPIGARYYKSTDLIVRNTEQLDVIEADMPADAFTDSERVRLQSIIDGTREIIRVSADPELISRTTVAELDGITERIEGLSERLDAGSEGLTPTAEALAQPPWGVTQDEIPLLPMTARGMLFDSVATQAKDITEDFVTLRNMTPAQETLIAGIRGDIDALSEANGAAQGDVADERKAYIKAVERIFKRLNDGTIFPAETMAGINDAMLRLGSSVDRGKGGLGFVDAVFFPGKGVVKSRTICIEQGSSRWLPKPLDVIATFGTLASPDIEGGGGYKGTVLLWWKWLYISDVVDFFIPDMLVDLLPGSYGTHSAAGTFVSTYKDSLLNFANGGVYLGAIPMFDGHIWDSVFRVLVALGFGILLGVPLGIYMGVSRFFKSFFDPLIELYRPVPPLAWAPLILTIFGIQDDGKIFLLFMVAFAIMVISARTGASGTQLSKIRASHSLGASNKQILRHVILPNALPEILTGVRISIGVCWGTLVAAEMLAGTTGIGFIENVARTVSNYELIWVTILIMGLLGLLFDLVMRQLIKILIPWRGKG